MHRPGRKHFEILRHLLLHIWCNPPKGIMFYHDHRKPPLGSWLSKANPEIDTSQHIIAFTDSAWQDCDDGGSTGSCVILVQGGIVDSASFVHLLPAQSSAEAEVMSLCSGCIAIAHVRMAFMEITTADPDSPLTVPVLVDSQAAIAITKNDKDTSRTRHMERRFLYPRLARSRGLITTHHVPGLEFQIADVGTKALSMQVIQPKLNVITPVIYPDFLTTLDSHLAKRGDENHTTLALSAVTKTRNESSQYLNMNPTPIMLTSKMKSSNSTKIAHQANHAVQIYLPGT